MKNFQKSEGKSRDKLLKELSYETVRIKTIFKIKTNVELIMY